MSRILLYDLEVTPMLGWAYKRWEANVLHVERESYIMCFAYKWLDEDEIHVVSQPDYAVWYRKHPYDDRCVVESLWGLLDQADIAIAHNAHKFDNKVANTRFIAHGLPPVSPYRSIDTLQVARRHFMFSSNSLANLSETLETGEKPTFTHSALWHSCVNGDKESWELLRAYCKQDVLLLEELYLKLRPYMSNHPNVDDEGVACPKCASVKYQSRGVARTNSSVYQRYQCQDCGGWFRQRLADRDVAKPNFASE